MNRRSPEAERDQLESSFTPILRRLWDAPAAGGLSLWEGIDLVVALTVTWIPLAPDYTRFARDRVHLFDRATGRRLV